MKITFIRMVATLLVSIGMVGCALYAPPEIPVATESVAAGSVVARSGQPQKLIGKAVSVGHVLPGVTLAARDLQVHSLDTLKGQVALLSIVPSLDTQVCERQTHLLGEASEDMLPPEIVRVTISRDLPFAQNRFAAETGYEHIRYLSDYRAAEFGLGTGLLLEDLKLLARAVMSLILMGSSGICRSCQRSLISLT